MRRATSWSAALLFACASAAHAAVMFPAGAIRPDPAKASTIRADATVYPVDIDLEKLASSAPGTVLALPGTDGRPVHAHFERYVRRDDGRWSWVGHVQTELGEQPAILTVGGGDVFGTIPQHRGQALRVETRAGRQQLVASGQGGLLFDPTSGDVDLGQTIGPRLLPDPKLGGRVPHPNFVTVPLIDVLVLYTPGLVGVWGSNAAAETRIAYLETLTNQALVDSDVAAAIRVVSMSPYGYADGTTLGDALDQIETDPLVAQLRAQYGADLVTLLRRHDPVVNPNSCGKGNLGGYHGSVFHPSQAFSTVSDDGTSPTCADTTFPHELGHNLGGHHDYAQTGGDYGAFPYSRGYRGAGFGTTMAYTVGSEVRIARFSSPRKFDCYSQVCGSAESADNARGFGESAPYVAAYMGTEVPVEPKLYIDNATVVEGDDGTRTARFAVALSAPASTDVAFDAVTANGTAIAGTDYTSLAMPGLRIPAGQTTAYVDVVVRGDTVDEPDETFVVRLSNVVGVETGDTEAIGTIRNDDTTVALVDQEVVEGDDGTKLMQFRVDLSVPTANPVTFRVRTVDGTATAGSDYLGRDLAGQSIPAGATSADFAVAIVGDLRIEGDETFQVQVSDVVGAKAPDPAANATILDDDTSISIDDIRVVEGDSGFVQAWFTVRAQHVARKPISFDIATVDGSARAGSDYIAKSGRAGIPVGGRSMAMVVQVQGDTTVEPDEHYTVVLTNVVGAEVTDDTGVGTILGDDSTATIIRSLSGAAGDQPVGVTVDARTGDVYVADASANVVRRTTPEGITTIFAGRGPRGFDGDGGLAAAALLDAPHAVAVDSAGAVYIGESGRVRRVGTDGIIRTWAGNGGRDPAARDGGDDGPAREAQLELVTGLALDAADNLFLVSGNRIRRVTPAGIITTAAGGNDSAPYGGDGGLAIYASLNAPYDIAIAPGGELYIADTGNHRIRRVDWAGFISTIAGDGTDASRGDGGDAIDAGLSGPQGLSFDADGNLYVVDGTRHVRRVDRFGRIRRVAGAEDGAPFVADGQPPTTGRLGGVRDVAAGGPDTFYLTETARVRRVGPLGLPGAPRVEFASAGDGEVVVTFRPPLDNGGSRITGYLVEAYRPAAAAGADVDAYTTAHSHRVTGLWNGNGYRFVVRALNEFGIGDASDPSNEVVPTASALPLMSIQGATVVEAPGGSGSVTFTVQLNRPASDVVRFDARTSDGTATAAGLDYTTTNVNDRFIGIGQMSATLTVPFTADANAEPDEWFVVTLSDVIGATVVQATAKGTLVSDDFDALIATIAGDGTTTAREGVPATESGLRQPGALAADGFGNRYVADYDRIRRIDAAGFLTTFAGGGTLTMTDGLAAFARLGNTESLAVDAAGDVHFADSGVVRKATRAGLMTTLAGNPAGTNTCFAGYADPRSLHLRIAAMAFDGAGDLYMADRCGVIRLTSWGGLQRVAGGVVTGYGGDGGPATAALFDNPTALAFAPNGDLLVADSRNFRIRAISPGGVVRSLYAIPSPLTNTILQALAVDGAGDVHFALRTDAVVYKLGADGSALRRIGNHINGFSGDGGPAHLAQIAWGPLGLAIDRAGNVLLSDTANRRVRRIGSITVPGAPSIGQVAAGNGEATVAIAPPASDGGAPVTGYEVMSSPAGGVDTDAGGISLARTVAGLANGTSYRFLARAINAAGPGPWSSLSNIAVPTATATPALRLGDTSVAEGDAGSRSLVVPLVLSTPAPAGGVVVTLSTTDGSAIAGSDYVGRTATVTLPAGARTGEFAVTVLGDTLPEPNEAFTVRVTAATGAMIADGVAQATIRNDDVATVSIGDVALDEGSEGTREARFEVRLDRVQARDVRVDIQTLDGTALAGLDYTGRRVAGLTIPAGETAATFAVDVAADRRVEGDEHFIARIVDAQGATIERGDATATIRDDDGAVPVLSVADAVVVEGDAGTRNAIFRVTLSEPVPHAVSVNAVTADGDATPGVDYAPRTSRIAFAPGQTVLQVGVAVNGDVAPEADETFRLYLAAPTGATVGARVAIGTIRDDEAHVEIDDFRVLEGNGNRSEHAITGRVVSSSARTAPITLGIAVREGTAVVGDAGEGDYHAYPATEIVIPPGVSTFELPTKLWLMSDGRIEPDETLDLEITKITNATGPSRPVRVTILDDDTGPSGILGPILGTGTGGYSGEAPWGGNTQLNEPYGIAAGLEYGSIYVVEAQNHRVRKRYQDGHTETIAGTGTPGYNGDGIAATAAHLDTPTDVDVDAAGNVYIVDGGNHRIRKVAPDGTITTIAGNGQVGGGSDGDLATEAALPYPRKLALHPDGRILVSAGAVIREITAEARMYVFAGTTTGYDGDGGHALLAKFAEPRGIAFGSDGAVFVADYGNEVVRRIGPDGIVQTVVGAPGQSWPGVGWQDDGYLHPTVGIGFPTDVAVLSGDRVLITTANHRVLQLNPSGVVMPFLGSGVAGTSTGQWSHQIELNTPSGLLLDGDWLYIADTLNHRILKTVAPIPPGAPTDVVATPGNRSATVTFVPSPENGSHYPANAFEVVSYPAGGIDGGAGTMDTTRVITGLENGVEYTFAVRALTSGWEAPLSARSNPVVPFDPDQPILSVASVAVTEGDDGNRTAVFDLKLSKGSSDPVKFAVSTVARTATEGTDYIAYSDPHGVIPAGQPGGRVAVVIRGDTVVEPNETFLLRLTDVVGATLAPGAITGTIRNDDQLKLSVGDVTLNEGNAGTRTATFTVRLSQPATAPVRYAIATLDGSARAGSDYVAAAASGQVIDTGARSRTFAVAVKGDTAVEPDETFRVRVSGVTGAVVADGQATGTIRNDDAEPPPTLTIDDVSVTEGDSGTKLATFAVRLSKPAPSTVTFSIATADGSAVAGSDYVARSQAGRTIAAGGTGASFAVTVNGDGAVEPDETFTVAVSGVTGATVADGSAVGTIADDDSALPVLATRADRAVLLQNAAATHVAVLANDVFDAARLGGGSLAVLSVDHGTATVDTRTTPSAADDRIRYKPATDALAPDRVVYRVCETGGRCVDGTLAVELRPALDVAHASPSGAGFVDVPLRGLPAMPAATFVATPLVAPSTQTVALGVDATVETPWDAVLAGTATLVRALAAPADGQPAVTRVLVDAQGAADVDLYLGVDTDGDGRASPGELRCTAAMTASRERCELTLTHPGTGNVQYWAMLHNRTGSAQSATAEIFAVPMSPPTPQLVATGPGDLPAGVPFAVRAAFLEPQQLPGEARAGYVRVRSGGVDRGMFPVRIDRTGTQAPALRLTAAPLAMRLAPGAAQDRLFVDVPAGATSLTVTVGSGQNVDLYLAHAGAASSPQIDAAPPRTAAVASATGPGGNETLTVAGAQLQPGRWYVTPVNAGPAAAWLSVRATIAGTGPVLRPGSFFNPARGGHGIFVYPAGGDWAGLWYTYFQDGSPTWYYVQGPKPAADGVFTGGLYRAAWQGTGNHLTQVGDVRITPSGVDGFEFSYQLDGQTGSEPMTSLGRGCPMLGGTPLDVSSHWFNPAKSGTGYSVQLWPEYEYYAAFVYDGHGVPRFLTAENTRFGGADATLDLEQLTGFCPLCARPGNPVRQTIGVFSRSLGGGTIQNITLDGIYAGGVPGAWTGNEAVQTLGGPGTTQGCAP